MEAVVWSKTDIGMYSHRLSFVCFILFINFLLFLLKTGLEVWGVWRLEN